MPKLVVLDVQQGDSLIVQADSGATCIIDCAKFGNRIPTIEFLQKEGIRELKFICLTHPHSDHYSGMLKLIQYCQDNHIKIERFWIGPFSPKEMEPDFFNQLDKDEYYELYKTLMDFDEVAFLLDTCNAEQVLYCEDEIEIKAISPITKSVHKINRQVLKQQQSRVNQHLNSFSIAISVKHSSGAMVLLSDSEIKDQKAIYQRQSSLKGRVKCFKLSHHGSSKNYYELMMAGYAMKHDNYSLISTGCNHKIHACPYVVESLSGIKSRTYATNYWNNQQPETDTTTSIPVELASKLPLAALEGFLMLTKPPQNSPNVFRPFHGDISIKYDDNGCTVTTATGRPALT